MRNNNDPAPIKVLFIGDVIGKPGRSAVASVIDGLISSYGPEFIIANGENSAHGMGITPETSNFLLGLGIDVITTGNHIWDQKSIIPYILGQERLLRPANYPKEAPGKGYGIFTSRAGTRVAVINLEGKVFMKGISDSPFTVARDLVSEINKNADAVIIDFHAEATSEKEALALFLDGKISALVGTHTHVQTNDEIIFPGGTAYITDVGMVGSKYSVLGADKVAAINKYLTGMPGRFAPEEKNIVLNAVLITIDRNTKISKNIEKIRIDV